MTREEICREVLEKPLEEIQQDIFFRSDNFQGQPWYHEFLIYLNMGICQTEPEHALKVQKALKVMGYPTHTTEKDGQLYLLPGNEAKPLWVEMKIGRVDELLKEQKKAVTRPSKKTSRQKERER